MHKLQPRNILPTQIPIRNTKKMRIQKQTSRTQHTINKPNQKHPKNELNNTKITRHMPKNNRTTIQNLRTQKQLRPMRTLHMELRRKKEMKTLVWTACGYLVDSETVCYGSLNVPKTTCQRCLVSHEKRPRVFTPFTPTLLVKKRQVVKVHAFGVTVQEQKLR